MEVVGMLLWQVHPWTTRIGKAILTHDLDALAAAIQLITFIQLSFQLLVLC